MSDAVQAVQPVPVTPPAAVEAAPVAEAKPAGSFKDLILARANQLSKEKELKAKEAEIEAKAKAVEPAKVAPVVEPAKAEPAKTEEPKVEAKAAAAAPETEDSFQKLWDTEQVPAIIKTISEDPKYKAIKAFGVVDKVPEQILKHFKETNESLTEHQMAQRIEEGIRGDIKAFVSSSPELKSLFTELLGDAPVAETKTTETAEAIPAMTEGAAAWKAKKEAKWAAKSAPATLSNRPSDVPAAKPVPAADSKPQPGESFKQWRKRTGAYS